jgi:hypothetical protein
MAEDKKSSDNVSVPERVWYYLLDFNDRNNWREMERVCGTRTSLGKLTAKQIANLFEEATKQDLKTLKQ